MKIINSSFIMFLIFFPSLVMSVEETSRCEADVLDVNSVDKRIKLLNCKAGDILYAQFFIQPDGTLPQNEDPVRVATKNCDFSKNILIEKYRIRLDDQLKDVYQLACVLGKYRGL